MAPVSHAALRREHEAENKCLHKAKKEIEKREVPPTGKIYDSSFSLPPL
jgi:hypothetical protein